jgi:hypothetical protein
LIKGSKIIKLSSLLLLVILLVQCRKPKEDDHTMYEEGDKFIVTCTGAASCYTTNGYHYEEYQAKVTESDKTNFKFGDQVWQKNKEKASYKNSYSESDGSTVSNFTLTYSGEIKSKDLIKGIFIIDEVKVSSSTTTTTKSGGVFRLARNG